MSDFFENANTEPASIRELSFGEKAVGLSFNPSQNEDVDIIKRKCAELIDVLNNFRAATQSSEVKRMCSVAITDIQAGQMWGVKAVTWKD